MTFVLWAIISHLGEPGTSGNVISGYSIGMTIYLPLSLGLPFILANYFRDSTQKSVAKRYFILSTLLLLSSLGLLIGIVIAIFTRHDISSSALAFLLSGCVVLGSTVQQLGRISVNLRQFLFGLSANLLLPAVWLGVLLSFGKSNVWISTLFVACFFVFSCFLFRSVSKSLPSSWLKNYYRYFDRSLIRLSIPLVPHLLAFAMIMQGVRMSASWTGSPTDIEIGHQVMLILNSGVLVVASIHGVLSVEMMSSTESRLKMRLRAYSIKYMAIGAVSSVAVMAAFLLPIDLVMGGMPRFDIAIVALMATVPVCITVYNFLATILMRHHKTKSLAIISLATLAIWFISFLFSSSQNIEHLLVGYCIILPLLFIFSFVALAWGGSLNARALFSSGLIMSLAFIPSALLFLISLRL
ncbi:hypothetical protein [Arthrobacter sp. H35-D1]|uniref:hypothetical protein n=1 Tax=Arthrobacter sp. H35-D1 TaxID=3046202 RepID=UPI0024B9A81E|nr:hypothetical protein [Arthrobacter sp. H35-D1]MDJ0315357.1 hypothetical protein [Arthrobacter sp. H35-D1]